MAVDGLDEGGVRSGEVRVRSVGWVVTDFGRKMNVGALNLTEVLVEQ